MIVLSLFDGMSCGQVALNAIGVKPEIYYASELDKHAIKVTQANWPETVQLGDVTKWKEWDIDWSDIDLLIGGSPCQGFSFAGKQLAFNDPRSKLFFVYVDIMSHIRSINPGVKFLLENVKMKKEYLDVISEFLGVEPVFINSALVSAQNRQRYYWANWEFGQPEDRGLVLSDILEDGFVDLDKSFCIDASYHKGGNPEQHLNKSRRQLVFNKPVRTGAINKGGQGDRVYSRDGKAISIGAQSGGTAGIGNLLVGNKESYRKLTPIECERLQTVPDNYTAHVSSTQRYKMLGNGWTVDVIAHIFKQAGIGQCTD